MAPRSSRNLKAKEVKIPHLTVANRKKMESWGLEGLFAVDWSGTYDNLLEELATNHFDEMDAKEKEASKKHKASIQTVFDSDTKTKPEEEKESPKEVPRVFCEGEASGSKPLDQKLDFVEWENYVESLGHETSWLFEAFHMEIRSVTAEAVARNMKEMFTPLPVVETDLQPWKEMGKNRCSEKIPEIAM
ncbi:hypothetical protein R1flu_028323 [Riccia fluitans]|uniref:Uncharacterized protein n=1 Tax=Riccia fluitans TaxID=41844 RepID=A0ABD1XLF7_9MARC